MHRQLVNQNSRGAMDLYRYFHPHHNPRLRHIAIRLQELNELKQAALELRRAIHRAEVRLDGHPVSGIRSEHFQELGTALDYVVESLQTLADSHPGDSASEILQMVNERRELQGWETWARLVTERLSIPPESESLQTEKIKANS